MDGCPMEEENGVDRGYGSPAWGEQDMLLDEERSCASEVVRKLNDVQPQTLGRPGQTHFVSW